MATIPASQNPIVSATETAAFFNVDGDTVTGPSIFNDAVTFNAGLTTTTVGASGTYTYDNGGTGTTTGVMLRADISDSQWPADWSWIQCFTTSGGGTGGARTNDPQWGMGYNWAASGGKQTAGEAQWGMFFEAGYSASYVSAGYYFEWWIGRVNAADSNYQRPIAVYIRSEDTQDNTPECLINTFSTSFVWQYSATGVNTAAMNFANGTFELGYDHATTPKAMAIRFRHRNIDGNILIQKQNAAANAYLTFLQADSNNAMMLGSVTAGAKPAYYYIFSASSATDWIWGDTQAVFNISCGTTNGVQFATSVSEKLAFHGSTPVAQRAGAAQAAVATTGATNITPYGFTTAAQADAIVTLVNELRAAAVEKGLIKGAA